ncbi:FMN-dependent NADH-azoreductase [Altericista sp. CCNU0014]|uniref:FMN-dependent NADH-azoreductase n=1 Tax=Altericista sp. CCNU0014 TaxID=3082949 RepID=UPI00384AA727
MAHILHIDASPRGERSVSRMLAKEFVAQWKATYPDDTVTYRDIGRYPVPLLSEAWIAGVFTTPDQWSPESAKALQISDELVDEFWAADRYVFSIPMYNFSIPAHFKAYIDQIVRVGRTFVLDEAGYKGLVHDRKMTIILAQGGVYPEGSPSQIYDLQTPYLKLIFGFMGITDIDFVYANGLALGDDTRSQAIASARSALKTMVA